MLKTASSAESFVPEAPARIVIPAIRLNAPVVSVGYLIVEENGQTVTRWDVPDWAAAGWLQTSARAGEAGNTVLVGHQNIHGRVFRNLEYLEPGDVIRVQAGEQTRAYRVSQIEILLEKDQPVEVRIANARWIARTDDERLTLVTCWPRNKDTHRLIVVAFPVDAPQVTTPTDS
jgi:sortase A